MLMTVCAVCVCVTLWACGQSLYAQILEYECVCVNHSLYISTCVRTCVFLYMLAEVHTDSECVCVQVYVGTIFVLCKYLC